jgi:hypothetical protein
MRPGHTRVPEEIRSHPHLCRRRASVPATPSRFLASPASPAGPPASTSSRGRPRHVAPAQPCCPHPAWAYRGRGGLGPLRAHGHPTGGPWRQLYCSPWAGAVREPHGPPVHGQRVAPALLVGAGGAWAAGLGSRAGARGCEGAPNPVLQGRVEAAAPLTVCSQDCLHDVRVTQGPRDALDALLRAVQEGEGSAAAARKRRSRSPHWGWGALDPVTQLRRALTVGERPLAMAPGVVPPVGQVRAPGGVPLGLTDGGKADTTARLAHSGQWGQPPRRQDQGPAPTPRGRPRPPLCEAQGSQTVRRRRLVAVPPRVVCGTLEAVQQGRAPGGGQSKTACVERRNLPIRQQGAAGGRRGSPRCQGADGGRPQLAWSQAYDHFCRPQASLRQALPQPEPTPGTGSAKQWRSRPPARAAGRTDRVWTRREVLLCRVPPWPQPAGV